MYQIMDNKKNKNGFDLILGDLEDKVTPFTLAHAPRQ